ncbi:MAG: hypothetical protein OT643_14980, partial [Bacteroidetes bacterium]|nr:hypothetical protein [Bacteroidota bacterium]
MIQLRTCSRTEFRCGQPTSRKAHAVQSVPPTHIARARVYVARARVYGCYTHPIHGNNNHNPP